MVYKNLISPANKTPQSKQARPDQIPNNAGGFGFQIDKWEQLRRFLVIGTEAGTYYVEARKLTEMNLDAVKACIAEDGLRVIKLLQEVSQEGRAIKNDPAILVLAACNAFGDAGVKAAAWLAITDVCRTGTHILHFASYADKLRRWGRSLRSAVARWYLAACVKSVDSLAYQMVKYQSRDGWSHKDLIRKCHVGSTDPKCAALFNWALHGYDKEKEHAYPAIVTAFELSKVAPVDVIRAFIEEMNLSREMIPTDKLNDPIVAKALAMKMPVGAMIRNLGNLSRAGLLTPGSDTFNRVITTLKDKAALTKARIHPISLLIALKTYASGSGVRGSHTWSAVPQVIDALDDAFYLSFDAVTPLNQRLLIALDCSGSMSADVVGTPGFSAKQAGAALALVTARTEPLYVLRTFDTDTHDWSISPKSRLDDVMRNIPGSGGTDVSAPIRWATDNDRKFDAIILLTDSETWAGDQHPYQTMMTYRGKHNIHAKLIVVAMAANNITVAAPDDPLSLTICGFDSSVPEVIRAFLASE